jgi:hypothetical protein
LNAAGSERRFPCAARSQAIQGHNATRTESIPTLHPLIHHEHHSGRPQAPDQPAPDRSPPEQQAQPSNHQRHADAGTIAPRWCRAPQLGRTVRSPLRHPAVEACSRGIPATVKPQGDRPPSSADNQADDSADLPSVKPLPGHHGARTVLSGAQPPIGSAA